jgi:hypothetical protein
MEELVVVGAFVSFLIISMIFLGRSLIKAEK